jgi:hypothetical protein
MTEVVSCKKKSERIRRHTAFTLLRIRFRLAGLAGHSGADAIAHNLGTIDSTAAEFPTTLSFLALWVHRPCGGSGPASCRTFPTPISDLLP